MTRWYRGVLFRIARWVACSTGEIVLVRRPAQGPLWWPRKWGPDGEAAWYISSADMIERYPALVHVISPRRQIPVRPAGPSPKDPSDWATAAGDEMMARILDQACVDLCARRLKLLDGSW